MPCMHLQYMSIGCCCMGLFGWHAAGVLCTLTHRFACLSRCVVPCELHRGALLPHADMRLLHVARREQSEAVRETMAAALLAGVASHHAGCLPGWKSLIERLFQRGASGCTLDLLLLFRVYGVHNLSQPGCRPSSRASDTLTAAKCS